MGYPPPSYELNIKTYFTRNGDIDIYSDGKRLVIKQ